MGLIFNSEGVKNNEHEIKSCEAERVAQNEKHSEKFQVLGVKRGGCKVLNERVLILLGVLTDVPSKQQPVLPLSDHRKHV